MARFDFNCPQCGKPIEADDSFCGQVVECPNCFRGIVVPQATTTEARKVRLHPIRREEPRSPQPQATGNVTLHPANTSGINGTSSNPPVPLAAGGALLRNEELIRDAFNRDVRTIKRTANVMLIREIVIFFTAGLVLAGTIAGVWYNYRKRNQEAQISWQHELERRKLMEEERARSAEARKKAQEEERLARQRERKRLEAEELAKAEARKAAEQRRKRYEALAEDYREVELDYLQNAPKSVLPGGVKSKTTYSCLMVDDVDGMAFFRIVVNPGQPMSVQRLSLDTAPVDVPAETFNERCMTESYLMVADSRPYVSPQKKSSRSYPVPREDGRFCPAIEDLGSRLHNIVRTLRLKTKFIRYEVFLQPKDKYRFELEPLPVGQIGFDESLSAGDFRNVVRTKLEAKAQENADAYRRMVASRGNGGGKTRAHAALERNLASTVAESRAPSSSRSQVIYTGYNNIIYQRHTTRSGPTSSQLGKTASLQKQLEAEERARAKRQAATLRRHAADDEKFYRENAVTDEKVDELLNRYVITFRLAK